MRYLVDTNVVSNQHTSPKVRNWVMQHYLQISLSSITVAEIVQGIEALPAGRRRARLEGLLEEMLAEYPVVGFGVPEAREWGRYVNLLGRPVPILDSLIAATALANNLELVTENQNDFPGIPTVNPATS